MWHAMHIRFSYKSTIIGFYIFHCRLSTMPPPPSRPQAWPRPQQLRLSRVERTTRMATTTTTTTAAMSSAMPRSPFTGKYHQQVQLRVLVHMYISSQVGSKYRHRFDLRAALSVHSITLRILVLIGRQTINNFASQVTAWSNDTLYSWAGSGCWVA